MTGVLHNAFPFRTFVFNGRQQSCVAAGNFFFSHHCELVCERVNFRPRWPAKLAGGGGCLMHHSSRVTNAWRKTFNGTIIAFFNSSNRYVDGFAFLCNNFKMFGRPFQYGFIKPSKFIGKCVTATKRGNTCGNCTNCFCNVNHL